MKKYLGTHIIAALAMVLVVGACKKSKKSGGSSPNVNELTGLWLQVGVSDQQAMAISMTKSVFGSEGANALGVQCQTTQTFKRSGNKIELAEAEGCPKQTLEIVKVNATELNLKSKEVVVNFQKSDKTRIVTFLGALGKPQEQLNPAFGSLIDVTTPIVTTPTTPTVPSVGNAQYDSIPYDQAKGYKLIFRQGTTADQLRPYASLGTLPLGPYDRVIFQNGNIVAPGQSLSDAGSSCEVRFNLLKAPSKTSRVIAPNYEFLISKTIDFGQFQSLLVFRLDGDNSGNISFVECRKAGLTNPPTLGDVRTAMANYIDIQPR